MTLGTRNRITRIFTLFTTIVSIFILILVGLQWVQQGFIYNKIQLPPFSNLQDLLFTKNLVASILSIFLLMIYAPVTGLVILFNFEKTHSSEILYFTGFLLGCFLESSRLLIPLFDLWNRLSIILVFSSRIMFFGEMLSIFCLLAFGLSTASSEAQDSSRTILLFLIASVFFTTRVPVKTSEITEAIRVTTGFPVIINSIRMVFILTSTICYVVIAVKSNSKEFILLAIDFLIMALSYSLLIFASSFFLSIVSALLLYIFTAHFITKLHNYYMWK